MAEARRAKSLRFIRHLSGFHYFLKSTTFWFHYKTLALAPQRIANESNIRQPAHLFPRSTTEQTSAADSVASTMQQMSIRFGVAKAGLAMAFFVPANHRSGTTARIAQHAYGNAQWADLIGAFHEASGQGVRRWAEAWMLRRGMPR